MIDALLDRFYTDDVTTFVETVVANVPADVATTAAAEARRYHALRVADAVTAAVEPYRLGKGKVGGGRFAKRGDIGIDILRDLLRGKGTARTQMHADFSKRHRADNDWGRGDLTPNNINRWATESFGPRPPSGQDANAWDAGRRELSAFLAALPRRSRTPGTSATRAPGPTPLDGRDVIDWGDRKPRQHDLPTTESYDTDLSGIGAKVPDAIAEAIEGGDGTKAAPFRTSDVNAAAFLLGHDQHVQLQSADQVATLLDQLSERVKLLKDTGADTPNFDLCKVTVPGTNLFCAESKGIPRIKMPQLGGKPLPGSPADSMPKNGKGEVDLSEPFIEHLKGLGIGVADRGVDASHLKASQIELNGTKIVGMMGALREGKLPPGAIFVSRDNYVVDGHHRWAANVGAEYVDGQQMMMPTHTIDADIIDVLALANEFALSQGIPQAGVGDMQTGGNVTNEMTDRFAGLDLPDDLKPNITDGDGTRANPFKTADPTTAAHLLHGDQHVELGTHPGQVTVVLDEVREMAKAIKANPAHASGADIPGKPIGSHWDLGDGRTAVVTRGGVVSAATGKPIEGLDQVADATEKPPPFDLCKLTVPGTSLFCVESKGIPRVKMPQLSGTPIPGSPADSMDKDGEGRVNLTSMFPEWLAERGISVTPGTRKVKEMKATQNELDGGKVGGIMQGWRDVAARGITRDPNAPDGVNQFVTADGEVIDGVQADRLAGLTDSIFVDRDGYVVDGHHRWAGAMGADVEHEGDLDIEMDTLEIDDSVDIVEVIALANAFALEQGIPQAAVGQETGDAIKAPVTNEMADRPNVDAAGLTPADAYPNVPTPTNPDGSAPGAAPTTPPKFGPGAATPSLKGTVADDPAMQRPFISQGEGDALPPAPSTPDELRSAVSDIGTLTRSGSRADLTEPNKQALMRVGMLMNGEAADGTPPESMPNAEADLATLRTMNSVSPDPTIATAAAYLDARMNPGAADAPVTNELADRPDSAPAASPSYQNPVEGSKPFVTADGFMERFGIPAGAEIQARYKDDDFGLVSVTKSDGAVQDVKVPWARLSLPSTGGADTSGSNAITFEAMPASTATISDADRTLGAAYNPRSQTLADLSSTNLLTRLQIADAMERNPPDAGTAQLLQKVQAESQKALRDQGITHVTLYRGMAGRQDSPFPHDTTGLSSWTTNPDTAASYAKGKDGTVFKATVPVEQILSWDVLGALRAQGADQPGAEILVARDGSTAERIGSGTFPFVANAPSAMAGTKADFDPWDVFHPKPAATTPDTTPGAAPTVNELAEPPQVTALPQVGAPDAPSALPQNGPAPQVSTLPAAAPGPSTGSGIAPGGGSTKKGLGGMFNRLRKGSAAPAPAEGQGAKPRAQRSATDLLGSDTSPEHIREVLKSGDLTDAQREELRKLLPTDAVMAALTIVQQIDERRRLSAVEEARAIAARIAADRVH